jgi:CRISPR-associated protein Cas1
MSQSIYIPLKPIPIKDRVSMIFVYYGWINVKDGAFVVIIGVDGEDRERKHILGRIELGSPR